MVKLETINQFNHSDKKSNNQTNDLVENDQEQEADQDEDE